MGYSQDSQFEKYPLLARLYEDYTFCRQRQIFSITRGAGGGKEEQITVLFPTGFSVLPAAGGLDDQSWLIYRIFRAFKNGDEQGTLRKLTR